MKKRLKVWFLVSMSALVAWSLLAPAQVVMADTADQKKQLEAQLTYISKAVDDTTLAVKVQTRWPVIGSPTSAVEFYMLQAELNSNRVKQALCINAYALDYATPGSPTVVVPTVMPTRTPAP